MAASSRASKGQQTLLPGQKHKCFLLPVPVLLGMGNGRVMKLIGWVGKFGMGCVGLKKGTRVGRNGLPKEMNEDWANGLQFGQLNFIISPN
ncbi:hypothetical protein H5410_025802 [Solanum commersonii]|uniref:Uncharacterized protein n=1 Tax=Solanum commersonii TaxID=4109 RepID=A0A9J5YZK8_SOLCO|nr:hypothetical protein H5410_025802 [Solanum commersonii]